jgi:SAM-dependent methyltransferase
VDPILKSIARRLPGLPAVVRRLREAAERRRLAGRSPQAIFDEYFQRNTWGGRTSRSGRGSDADQTRVLVEALPALWADLGVRRVLDVPCGDFEWMRRVDLGTVQYVGGDIVPALVDANRRAFARPGVQFQTLDLLRDPLPSTDLVLCRDCLVHLSFADARRALAGIAASDATWCLLTTFTERSANADIVTGQWRPLNLTLPPFDLPPPTIDIVERCTEGDGQYADKALALWRVQDLRRAIDNSA